MIKVQDYRCTDLLVMNVTRLQPEIHTVNLYQYAIFLEEYSKLARTIRDAETGEILMVTCICESVLDSTSYVPKGSTCYEGIFIMSEGLVTNFRHYGKAVLSKIFSEIDRFPIDFLLCMCYNSNIKGKKLVTALGFEDTGSMYGTNTIFKYKVGKRCGKE